MDFDTFKRLVDKAESENLVLFGLEHDNIPSTEEISAFERQYQIQLPEKYVKFLLEYGGGYFGYANVYSLDKHSNFYLLNNNELPFKGYLHIADNGCGDFYSFCIENGRCCESIVFCDHETGKIHNSEFSDILEYLIKTGIKGG